jgi:hypothetical protein
VVLVTELATLVEAETAEVDETRETTVVEVAGAVVVVGRIVVVVRFTNVVVLERGRRGAVVVVDVPVVGLATRVVVVLVEVVEVDVPLGVGADTLFLTEVAANVAASLPAAS